MPGNKFIPKKNCDCGRSIRNERKEEHINKRRNLLKPLDALPESPLPLKNSGSAVSQDQKEKELAERLKKFKVQKKRAREAAKSAALPIFKVSASYDFNKYLKKGNHEAKILPGPSKTPSKKVTDKDNPRKEFLSAKCLKTPSTKNHKSDSKASTPLHSTPRVSTNSKASGKRFRKMWDVSSIHEATESHQNNKEGTFPEGNDENVDVENPQKCLKSVATHGRSEPKRPKPSFVQKQRDLMISYDKQRHCVIDLNIATGDASGKVDNVKNPAMSDGMFRPLQELAVVKTERGASFNQGFTPSEAGQSSLETSPKLSTNRITPLSMINSVSTRNLQSRGKSWSFKCPRQSVASVEAKSERCRQKTHFAPIKSPELMDRKEWLKSEMINKPSSSGLTTGSATIEEALYDAQLMVNVKDREIQSLKRKVKDLENRLLRMTEVQGQTMTSCMQSSALKNQSQGEMLTVKNSVE